MISMAEFLLREEIVFVWEKQTLVKSLEIGDETWGQSQNNPGEELTAGRLAVWVGEGWRRDGGWKKAGGCLQMGAGSSAVKESWENPPGEGWAESLRVGMPGVHWETVFPLLLYGVCSIHKLLCCFLEFEQWTALYIWTPRGRTSELGLSWALQQLRGLLKSWKGHGMGARPGSSRPRG